jgi:hypothetical protein
VVLSGESLIVSQGFDEFMNVVLDDAEEVDTKKLTRVPLGRTLLKGDNITLMMLAGASTTAATAAPSSSSSSTA